MPAMTSMDAERTAVGMDAAGALAWLEDAAERALSTGLPEVVSLEGPGAAGVARAWSAAAPGAMEALRFGEPLADCVDGPVPAVWLHDSAVAGDLLLGQLRVWPVPVVLVCTGPARECGRPEQHTRLVVEAQEEDGGPTGAEPTPILWPWTLPDDPGALRDVVEQALAEGDVARAFAANERLGGTHRTARMRRLLELGRFEELDALRYSGEPHDFEGLLLLVRAALQLLRYPRARGLLQVAARLATTDAQRARLDYWSWRAKVRPSEPPVPPGPSRELLLYRQWMLGRSSAAPLENEGTALARVFLDVGLEPDLPRRRRAAEDLVRMGQLTFARRFVLTADDPEPAVRVVQRAYRLLEARKVDEARELLEHWTVIARSGSEWAAGWHLVRACVAGLDGDVSVLHRVLQRIRRLPRLDVSGVLQVVRSLRDAGPFCRVHTWSRLAAWLERPASFVPLVEPSFEAPPVVGDFELDAAVGQGGMGAVWQGRFAPTGRAVAIKLLTSEDPEKVALFRREIDIISRLDHPAIVSVLDYGEVSPVEAAHRPDVFHPGQGYLVMELVEGGSLAEALGRLDWVSIQSVLLALLDALAYAHASGVVHRDLKPANILIEHGTSVRLSDFGLSGMDERKVAGTPTYMAPEQFRKGPVDGRCDLFALGCLGWALATGLPPRIGSPAAIVAAMSNPLPELEPLVDVPDGYEAWLRGLMRIDPANRPSSAAEAAAGLLALAAPAGGVARPIPPRGIPGPSEPTFVLEPTAVLSIAADDLALDVQVSPERRVRHLFRRQHPYRPRLPNTALLDRGDPEVVGNAAVREALVERTEAAAAANSPAFVGLVGRDGVGRRSQVRAALLDLRIRGGQVADAPVDAPVDGPALVAVDEPWSDALEAAWRERAAGKPWVVVFTRYPADRRDPAVTRLTVRRLDVFDLYWVVRARIPVEPAVALEIARRSVGLPAVAQVLIQDFMEQPGFVAAPWGLRPAGPMDDRPHQTTEAWRAQLQARDGQAWTRALVAAAVLSEGFRTETWVAMCEALCVEPDLRALSRVASLDARWRIPPSLRRVMLESLSNVELRSLHDIAATIPRSGRFGEVEQLRHAVLAGHPDALSRYGDALSDLMAHGIAAPVFFVDVLAVELDARAVAADHPHRGVLAMCRLLEGTAWKRPRRRSELEGLAQRARENGWTLVWAVAERLLLKVEPGLDPGRAVRAGVRASVATGRVDAHLYALGAAVVAYQQGGRPWRALLDRLLERASRPDVALRTVLLVRASLATFLQQPSLLPRTVPTSIHGDFAYVSWALTWMHLLVDTQRFADAVQFGETHYAALEELESGVGMVNFALALAAEGHVERARTTAVLAARITALGLRRELLRICQLLLMALGTDWPTRQWEDLRSATSPEVDASIIPVLERVVARADPQSARTRWLQSAIRTSKQAGYRLDPDQVLEGPNEV